uniref:Uncharacterized protein n=1 Tax=Crocodylus porosus TaxID=8502 RepID=A0A7M4F1C2_CROPO
HASGTGPGRRPAGRWRAAAEEAAAEDAAACGRAGGRLPPPAVAAMCGRFLLMVFLVAAHKHHGKSRKQQQQTQLLEVSRLSKNTGLTPDPSKGIQPAAEMNTFVLPTSTISSSNQADQDLSDQVNDSLRWDGVLEDPAAEEERLRIYKLNRRKRYELYIQQHLPKESHPTPEHSSSPQCAAPNADEQTGRVEDSSSSYIQGGKGDTFLITEQVTSI